MLEHAKRRFVAKNDILALAPIRYIHAQNLKIKDYFIHHVLGVLSDALIKSSVM